MEAPILRDDSLAIYFEVNMYPRTHPPHSLSLAFGKRCSISGFMIRVKGPKP